MLLLFLTTLFAHGQKFHFRADGGTDFIIYTAGRTPAKNLYNRSVAWVQTNYPDGNNAFRARAPYSMIRISGKMTDAITIKAGSGKSFAYDATYFLEFHYKNGKYRAKYFHHAFVVNGQRPLFKLADIVSPNADAKNVQYKKQYEAKIQKLLDSHQRFLSKPR